MRTTLTLDDDVEAMLKGLRAKSGMKLNELVNRALRAGLLELEREGEKREPYRMQTVRLGGCLVANLDNVSEVLEVQQDQ